MDHYLETQLQRFFNYKQFRKGQKEIITDVLDSKDVLGILPTGSGKSLCYQLPSLLLPHITVVVSPLISLMIDQVRETKAFHIKEVIALHSLMSYEERIIVLKQLHNYKIVYISPELIQNEQIISAFNRRGVSLFVIDEAHCISQWGYDFRPDYLRLNHVIEKLGNPPILALSGTITSEIEQDIISHLNSSDLIVHKFPMDRENISLLVEKLDSNRSKNERIIEILQNNHVPTIIYFSSRKVAEEVARLLEKKLENRNVAYYHGGLDPESRLKIQQQFLYDQLDVICATSAFGMGINKKNIRLVIHYHIPTQKESFIQEIGRAGRDGKESVSILLFEDGDEYIPQQLIEGELPTEIELRKLLNYLFVLYENNQSLPIFNELLSEKLQINETKLNLLKFQLESHGIIENNEIYYEKDLWIKAFNEMIRFIQTRKEIKETNLTKMLAYIFTNQCLRMELYKEFQEHTASKAENCCSVCGFSWSWLKSESNLNTNEYNNQTWQQQLAILLEIGENNGA